MTMSTGASLVNWVPENSRRAADTCIEFGFPACACALGGGAQTLSFKINSEYKNYSLSMKRLPYSFPVYINVSECISMGRCQYTGSNPPLAIVGRSYALSISLQRMVPVWSLTTQLHLTRTRIQRPGD